MPPVYVPAFMPPCIDRLLSEVPWEQRTTTRSECFMAPGPPYPYTYGQGRGVRTYMSIPMSDLVGDILARVNDWLAQRDVAHGLLGWGPMTGCFLNRYDHDRQHLGWHADNFDGMDHTRCVAVVSFGEPRPIWWRTNPPARPENWATLPSDPAIPVESQVLENGSLFLMPPGMQHTHEHRIPKGSRSMGPRVSLTFRAFK